MTLQMLLKLSNIIAAGRHGATQGAEAASSGPNIPTPTSQMNNHPPERVAHNAAMRFRNLDKKFSGELGKCWQEYVDEYRQMSRH